MKRLKMYLSVRETNVTYKEMYEGNLHIVPNNSQERPYNISEPIYWKNEIFYEISRSNRIELSKPTITIGIPIKKLKIAEGLIDGVTKISQKGIPAADYCLRSFLPYVETLNEEIYNRKRPEKENGRYHLYEPNGKVLKRNCSYFKKRSPKHYSNQGGYTGAELKVQPKHEWYLELKLMIQLPEKKVKKSVQMLTSDLPDAVENYIEKFQLNELKRAVTLYNKQEEIRAWLHTSDFCAFIADGSILPREKDTDEPMKKAVAFSSKDTDQILVGDLLGMGIRKGVTVITGGGYSGKSTLLDAVSEGIYNHKQGDGREYVITDASAMKISAEDGRSVKNVNISPFIRWIPGGRPENFSTEHASGSTSQAANIVEAIQYGSKLLLIDEDKSATNFMIRDAYMQRLVKNEPIVPYTDRVQELSRGKGVSTILVIGGSSEYLKVSDHVILMEDFNPREVTSEARALVREQGTHQRVSGGVWEYNRLLMTKQFTSYPEDKTTEHMKVSEQGFIELGDECVDIRMIHNIAGQPQLAAIAFLIRKLENSQKEQKIRIEQVVETMLRELENQQLDEIYSTFFTECGRWLELPRKQEVLAVIHRMRKIRFQMEEIKER